MQSKRFIWFVLLGLALVVLLAACSGGGGGPTSGDSGTKTFTVSTTEFAFSPDTFNAKPGEKLTFKVTNKGTVEHTLVIQSPDGSTELAKLSVQPGETKSLEFTAKDAAVYPIVCDIAGHKEAGMKGTLTVQ